MNIINISIIIPTYKREVVLCNTIKSVLENIKSAEKNNIYCELIIIDQTLQHDESKTTEYLNYISNIDNVTYIQHLKPNLPNARNIGITKSKGKYIIFIDDDVLLDKDFITQCYQTYITQKCDSVVGRVTLCNNSPDNILLNNNNMIKDLIRSILFNILGKNKAGIITKHGIILGNYSILKSGMSDSGRGCCMSFNRDVFNKIGLFDTNYKGNALREETDLFIRMKKANLNVYYNKDMHLFHLMNNIGGTRANENNEYWKTYFENQTYFYYKNFNSSFYTISIILIFDIIKCFLIKINALKLIKGGLKKAQKIL